MKGSLGTNEVLMFGFGCAWLVLLLGTIVILPHEELTVKRKLAMGGLYFLVAYAFVWFLPKITRAFEGENA